MTCPLLDNQTLEGWDYAEPCKDCGKTATAFVQKSHSAEGCWSPGVFRCGPCLDLNLREYAVWLIDCQGEVCGRSQDMIGGGLEENTRVMPL